MLPTEFLQDIRFISKRGYSFLTSKTGDVGHDLFVDIYGLKQRWLDKVVSWFLAERAIVILPFTNRVIPSGIFLSLPEDLWVKIEARSSTARKRLQHLGGIIDSGYRGELHAVLHNASFIPRVIKDGERYVQAIFHQAHRPSFARVDSFSDVTQRGASGFGSTGK